MSVIAYLIIAFLYMFVGRANINGSWPGTLSKVRHVFLKYKSASNVAENTSGGARKLAQNNGK